jgi:hydroxymethylbilane synthase
VLLRRPDVQIAPLRGNVDTRLGKAQAGEYDAVLLAGAGLLRLGLEHHVTEWLSLEVMLPAPGQGALAVQCRADDLQTQRLLSALEDPPARIATTAERSFLSGLGGGCSLPVAAFAQVGGTPEVIQLEGLVVAPDGRSVIRLQGAGNQPIETGLALAQRALEQGAAQLLAMETA